MSIRKNKHQLSVDNGYTLDSEYYGGMVHHFWSLNEATGVAPEESIGGAQAYWGGAVTHVNNGDGTSTGVETTQEVVGALSTPLYHWRRTGDTDTEMPVIDSSKSFITFSLHDHPASGQLRYHGNGVEKVTYAYGSGNCSIFVNGSIESAAGSMTASAADQLDLCIVDRENNTVKFYEGSDGTTQVGSTIAIESADTVPLLNEHLAGQVYTKSYGYGVLQFPAGIPSNIQDIFDYIAAELRADRKGSWITHIDALFPQS